VPARLLSLRTSSMSSSSSGSSKSFASSQNPSPPRSPDAPIGAPGSAVTLDSLIPHLLASKRSLSSINHVWRAKELCTSTKSALERNAVTTARTSFLRSGIVSQLNVLSQVQRTSENTSRRAATELEAAVRDLDDADLRLRTTLGKLRTTIVEAQLRPEGEERKNLLDFVDESGIEGLVRGIKNVIDRAGKGLDDFQEGYRQFEGTIDQTRSLLNKGSDGTDSFKLQNVSGERRSPIPDLLHNMEDHTREIAVNLESLVSHFDLCASAIKHTEGGGDAASKLAGDLPEGVDIGRTSVDTPPAPLSDEERMEMMRVLEEDAAQVDEVVMEIRERVANIEVMHDRVEAHTDLLEREHASITTAFKLLEDIGHKLPGYITRSQTHLLQWDDEKINIEERLEELEALREFYDGFLKAYDNLIIEIGRRKAMEEKMDKVVQEATLKLNKFHEDDIEEREAFTKEQGDFLPMDIWPGLMDAPLRFELGSADGNAGRVPAISKSVIREAILRVHGK